MAETQPAPGRATRAPQRVGPGGQAGSRKIAWPPDEGRRCHGARRHQWGTLCPSIPGPRLPAAKRRGALYLAGRTAKVPGAGTQPGGESVQTGRGGCKGSRPTLPVHHTTVVLHRSYTAAVYMPSIGVYRYLDGDHWVWGYHHTIGAMCLHKY